MGWDGGIRRVAGGSCGVEDVEEEVAGFDADHFLGGRLTLATVHVMTEEVLV